MRVWGLAAVGLGLALSIFACSDADQSPGSSNGGSSGRAAAGEGGDVDPGGVAGEGGDVGQGGALDQGGAAGEGGATPFGGAAGNGTAGDAGGSEAGYGNDPLGEGGASADGIPLKLVGRWTNSFSDFDGDVEGVAELLVQANGSGSYSEQMTVTGADSPAGGTGHTLGGLWEGAFDVDTTAATITLHATHFTSAQFGAVRGPSSATLVFGYNYSEADKTLYLKGAYDPTGTVGSCGVSCDRFFKQVPLENDPLGGGTSPAGIPSKLVGGWSYEFSEYDDEVTGNGTLTIQADGHGDFSKFVDLIAGIPPHDNSSGEAWAGTIAVDTEKSTITLSATTHTPLGGTADASTDVLVFAYRYIAKSDTLMLSGKSGIALCYLLCDWKPELACKHTL